MLAVRLRLKAKHSWLSESRIDYMIPIVLLFFMPLIAAETDTPSVVVDKTKLTEIFDEVSYPARIQSKVNATIRADTDGFVVRLAVTLGAKVAKGTTLLQLKNDDPVYQYVSINQTSPVAGVVSSFEVAEGASVKKGQTLLTVVDPNKLKINVEVAASDVKNIKPGQLGIFEYGVNKKIDARVSGISPLIDGVTGTATAEMTAQFPAMEVGPGFLGRVVFQLNKRRGIQVPEQAISYRGKTTFLRIVDQDLAHNIQVKMGRTQRGLVEILDGAKPDRLFVLSASGFIADGQKVKIQENENVSR